MKTTQMVMILSGMSVLSAVILKKHKKNKMLIVRKKPLTYNIKI